MHGCRSIFLSPLFFPLSPRHSPFPPFKREKAHRQRKGRSPDSPLREKRRSRKHPTSPRPLPPLPMNFPSNRHTSATHLCLEGSYLNPALPSLPPFFPSPPPPFLLEFSRGRKPSFREAHALGNPPPPHTPPTNQPPPMVGARWLMVKGFVPSNRILCVFFPYFVLSYSLVSAL